MKECDVPGLFGDVCRGQDTTPDGKQYCVLLEAASLEDAESIRDFEPTARENSERCLLFKTVIRYIEQQKLE